MNGLRQTFLKEGQKLGVTPALLLLSSLKDLYESSVVWGGHLDGILVVIGGSGVDRWWWLRMIFKRG